MDTYQVVCSIPIGSFTFNLTTTIITQWIVIAILALASFLMTRNLKLKPGKLQAALEKLYQSMHDLVLSTMGDAYESFLPYIGTLMIYLLILNFLGLIGIKPPTQDLSVTAALAIVTFLVVNINAIKKNGALKYAKSYTKPFLPMLPINVMEKLVLPVSLALRLFGNMVAATLLIDMVYEALRGFGVFAQVGLPIFVHGYFDIFDGGIQMLVFTMLTMINIKVTAEH